jgi:hypothetical protein
MGFLVDEGDCVGREELAAGAGVFEAVSDVLSAVSPGAASPRESRVRTRDQRERFFARESRCRVSGRLMRTSESRAFESHSQFVRMCRWSSTSWWSRWASFDEHHGMHFLGAELLDMGADGEEDGRSHRARESPRARHTWQ